MKRLTPEEIDELEWRKHELRHEGERRAMEEDAIRLGAVPAEIADMHDADLLALLTRLEDEQEGSDEEEGDDPIAALLDELPAVDLAAHAHLIGQQVPTEHGDGQVVAARTRLLLRGWSDDILVELPDGTLTWTDPPTEGSEESAA